MEAFNSTRRSFLKSATLVGGTLIGGQLLSCSIENSQKKEAFFNLPSLQSKNGNENVSGLLFSQVGYDLGQKARVILRFTEEVELADNFVCRLVPKNSETPFEKEFAHWGEIWKNNWFIVDFEQINEEGEWDIEVYQGDELFFRDEGFRVRKDILWKETYDLSSVDMLERRKHFTNVGSGWMDAGTLWVESPAQSAMIICLTDLALCKKPEIDEIFLKRIYEQIKVGSDYLVLTQKKAEEKGEAKGAMLHDALGHDDVLPNDVLKAIVALYRSASVLPQDDPAVVTYRAAAKSALDWALNDAKPLGNVGFNCSQRGLADDYLAPKNEWPTRDLIFFCWSALEAFKAGNESAKLVCKEFAEQIMQRQFIKSAPENGFYGHFKEFDSHQHSENSWVHNIVDNTYGVDAGGLFPNYLEPFFQMLALWPEDDQAKNWAATLENFAVGFLIPSCKLNPFYIVPNGIFGEEGPVWFAGPFHGTNSIYGYTAGLAFQLAQMFRLPELVDIAYGNLQWIAGLNAGITKENLKASVVYTEDVPEGVALPSSMICGVGNRWSGTWFQTRGVICNGFSTGEQFKMDVFANRENDGPFSFTDEDWIPHSSGWLTGLMKFKTTI